MLHVAVCGYLIMVILLILYAALAVNLTTGVQVLLQRSPEVKYVTLD